MIMVITYSFRISMEYFTSFRGPLLLKPVTGQELFFADSFSKPALPHASKLKITAKQEVTCCTILDTLPIFVAFQYNKFLDEI
jgi:hypothetical protein